MTVKELIDTLNKVEDKSKDVIDYDGIVIVSIKEHWNDIMLY